MVNHCKPHCDLSKTRLNYLQQRLQKNKEIMKKYDDIIEEQLQAGIVEHVSTENENHISTTQRFITCLTMPLYARIKRLRKFE